MKGFNQITLAGNLTHDPEVRYTQSGSAVCSTGIAINERRKEGDEWIEETTFIDITLWDRKAEVAAEYLRKGSPVLVSGRLRIEEWENDGVKRRKANVVVNEMTMLGGDAPAPPKEQYSEPVGKPDAPADDIPF